MKPQPYVCPTCGKDPETYFGRLVFPDELPPTAEQYEAVAAGGGSLVIPPIPMCPHHPKVALIPANVPAVAGLL